MNVPFALILGHIRLLALFCVTVFSLLTLILVRKLVINSIVEVLVVEFFICSVNFADPYPKPDQLVLVFHLWQTIFEQSVLLFHILLSRVKRTQYD